MDTEQREGILVNPHCRLDENQVKTVDGVSRELLEDPGILCYNKRATEIFKDAGAKVEEMGKCVRVKISSRIIDKILETAPSKVVLGAHNPSNKLILDAYEPRVRFGTGSEANIFLDVGFEDGKAVFTRREGTIDLLGKAAHLCENLDNVDFFIRCLNIRDEQVNESNKDVNKYLISLCNISKHVQAGLTSIEALDDVIELGHIFAGGQKSFEKNPVLSFITCVIKSPFQMVDDTASKLIAISERRAPVVISSSPMAGATAPFDEFGMVAQINAELLAGVALNQLVSPGAPVLYGAVPVRTRLDTLDDMYGAPEFNHYNLDCAQMARYYGLPCYSTSGVADSSVPGIQATVEKLITYTSVPRAGAQYIHYAFGLLERTNVFCPVQAVMDNEHIGMAKYMLTESNVDSERRSEIIEMIREVMSSDHKTYMYHLPLPTKEDVYVKYPLEDEEGALAAASKRYNEIMEKPRIEIPSAILKEVNSKIKGILPQAMKSEMGKV